MLTIVVPGIMVTVIQIELPVHGKKLYFYKGRKMKNLFLTILLLCASQLAFAGICPASSQISISQDGDVTVLVPGWHMPPGQKAPPDAKTNFIWVDSTHYNDGDGFRCYYGSDDGYDVSFNLMSTNVFKETHYSSSWKMRDDGVDRSCRAELTQCTW